MAARAKRDKQESSKDYTIKGVIAKFLFVWSWGHISQQFLQTVAAKVKEDIDEVHTQYQRILKKHKIYDEEVQPFTDLNDFAGIGNNGLWGNDCHRELMKNHIKRSDPVSLPLRSKIMPLGWYMDRNQYFLWPHERFSAVIYHWYLPSVEKVQEFWDAMTMTGKPQMDDAQIQGKTNLWSHCIPSSIHGDGAPVARLGKSWGKLIDVWHWVSMLGQGGTIDMCMYTYSVYQRSLSNVFGHKTYNWIQRKMAWSLCQLYTGRWSTHDDLGKPFPEDRMFMLRPPVFSC